MTDYQRITHHNQEKSVLHDRTSILIGSFVGGLAAHLSGVRGSLIDFGPDFDRGMVSGIGLAALFCVLGDLLEHWSSRRTSGSSSAPE